MITREQIRKIRNATEFRNILNDLTPEQCTLVCEAIKDRLPRIIQSSLDFRNVLEKLTPEQRTPVYEAMKDNLLSIIEGFLDFESILDFQSVLPCLTPKQCRVLCESIKYRLLSIIQSSSDFESVLCCLTPEQRTPVCEAMKDRLPAIIQSPSDFQSILCYLTPEQHRALCEGMKDRLPSIIQSCSGFGNVLEKLTPEQCTVVCKVMKDRLRSIFEDAADFLYFLPFLTLEQCRVLCKAMKNHLPHMIKYGYRDRLQELTPERRTLVNEAMKDGFCRMIGDYSDFLRLNSEQFKVAWEVMKDRLPSMIQSLMDFKRVSVCLWLTLEKYRALCEAMKNRLPSIIKDSSDFKHVLLLLTSEQRTPVYEAMKNCLPRIIRSSWDFQSVFCHLTPEQRTPVYEAMKDRLPNMIIDPADHALVCKYLSLEQVKEINFLRKRLASLKSSDSDNGVLWDSSDDEEESGDDQEKNKSLFSVFFTREKIGLDLGEILKIQEEPYVFIGRKNDGRDSIGYDGVYVTKKAYDNQRKEAKFTQLKYKFGEIFFLKMFPKGKRKVEGFTELLARNVISKMIEQRFISNFYVNRFSPAKSIELPDNHGFALWQPFIVDPSRFFKMECDDTKYEENFLLRTLFGDGREPLKRTLSSTLGKWCETYYDDIKEHVQTFNQTLRDPERKELLRSIITSSIKETYKYYKRMYEKDWKKTKTDLFQYIYGESYQDFYLYVTGRSNTDHAEVLEVHRNENSCYIHEKYNTETLLTEKIANIFFDQLQQIIDTLLKKLPQIENSTHDLSLSLNLHSSASLSFGDTKLSRSDNIEPRLIINGLELHKVPGDGNCFFHTVAHQLGKLGIKNEEGESYTHDLLRALVSSHVEHMPDLRSLFADQEYLDLSKLSGWVDEGAIRSLANFLKITIHILRPEGDEIWVNSEGTFLGAPLQQEATENPQIHLYYNGVNHYDSLCPTNLTEETSMVNSANFHVTSVELNAILQIYKKLQDKEELLDIVLTKQGQDLELAQEKNTIMGDRLMKGYYSSIVAQILSLKMASLTVSSGFVDANRFNAGKVFSFLSSILAVLCPPIEVLNAVSSMLERFVRENLLKAFDFFGISLSDTDKFADEVARLLVRARYHSNDTFSKEDSEDDVYKLMKVIIEAEPPFNKRPNFCAQMLVAAIFKVTPCFDPLPGLDVSSQQSSTADSKILSSFEQTSEFQQNSDEVKILESTPQEINSRSEKKLSDVSQCLDTRIMRNDIDSVRDEVENLKKYVLTQSYSQGIPFGNQMMKQKISYEVKDTDKEISQIKTDFEQLVSVVDSVFPQVRELTDAVQILKEKIDQLESQLFAQNTGSVVSKIRPADGELQKFIRKSLEDAVREYKTLVNQPASFLTTHQGHPEIVYDMLLQIALEKNIDSQLTRLINYMDEAVKSSGMRNGSLIVFFINNLDASKDKMPELYKKLNFIHLEDEEKQRVVPLKRRINGIFMYDSDISENCIKLEKWKRAFKGIAEQLREHQEGAGYQNT